MSKDAWDQSKNKSGKQNGWREAFVGKWGQAEAAGTVGLTIL